MTHLGYFNPEKETLRKGWTGAENLNLTWVQTPNCLALRVASPGYTVMLHTVASTDVSRTSS
jgi:hypothetical protein